jgi:sulfotransferase family protein
VSEPEKAWRRATWRARPWPDFVILGTQRGGTTSLYQWLSGHPGVAPATRKEIHYFDLNYAKGEAWYRSHFPRAAGREGTDRSITGEASPYLLFHPLAPARAAADLPATTRFIVLLREPAERAVSHYWHERKMKAETLPLAAALAAEGERLAGQSEVVEAGGRSFAHFHFSYAARGRYAGQLERWFAHVGRERILVLESEKLFTDPTTLAAITDWLGVAAATDSFPAVNEAPRPTAGPDDAEQDDTDGRAVDHLRRSFEGDNEALFTLLGHRLWGR